MNSHDNYGTGSHKDPAQLEREIDQQRNHIEGIVKQLESKLTPGDILGEVMQMGKGSGRELIGTLGQTIKENPLPALVTAVGMYWLYSSSHRINPRIMTTGVGYNTPASNTNATTLSSASSTTAFSTDSAYNAGQTMGVGHSSGSTVGGKLGAVTSTVGEKLGSAKSVVGEKLGSAKSTVSDKTSGLVGSARVRASQASDGFSRMLDENPMAVGAIGIAVGALLGAVIPKTRKEDEWLGERSDRITGQIKDVAKRGYEQVSTATKEITGSMGVTGTQQDRSAAAAGSTLGNSTPTAH